jgi:competence protein ComEC
MPRRGKHAWQDGEIHKSSPQGWFARAVAGFSRALTTESDRWFLWLPVLFAGGILIYFALPSEPDPTLAIALLIGAAGLALALKEAPLGLAVAGALLTLASGFATAKLHTELARAPVLARELRYVEVKAWLETVDGQENGRTRATLRVIAVDRLSADETPYRVRVTGASDMGQNAKTGDAVRLKATLRPPPEPVEPGAFDFGRTAWFSRLGAVGYATTDLERLEEQPSPPLGLALWAAIDRLRDPVNARVRAALPGQTGDIAAALITGARGGIPKEVNQAMRDSGLAHILSISGLHMVIMAGTMFWLVRALLALFPYFALRFPIRKWAAAAALFSATFYLLLSGAAVPTVRSWIMMSIVLVAVMLDRPALTMRNVAIAALAVLLIMPQSLFDPSFEMSFAAVVGLVALFEYLSQRERDGQGDISPIWHGLRKVAIISSSAALTTMVASLAIAPFAIYHFHRMTHYGLAANLIVTPIVSLLIMPMALLALLAMPLGLEYWPLQAMGYGIELMVATGQWVASWPGAISVLPSISGAALLLMVLGGLWLCLWQTRMRAFGLVIAACGLALAPIGTRPDILIDRDGKTVALRGEGNSLALPPATRTDYSTENWLLADGDDRDVAAAASANAFRCDSAGCIGKVKGKTIALVRHPSALEEDCRLADIVVAPFTVSKACRAARVVVDRKMLKEHGAYALYIDGLSIRAETVAEARGMRPWVPERPPHTPAPDLGVGHAFAHGDADKPTNERLDSER